MRLFIAADLPYEMCEALAETSALLRESVRGRYVGTDSFHVTLAFLGEVEGHRVDGVCSAIESSCGGFGPFEVELGDFGCFGKRSKATLWQGFEKAGQLVSIADSLRGALSTRGFTFDEKPFMPHVTLMRAADLSHGTLPAPVRRSGVVCSVSLYRSDLSGPRPVYDPLHTRLL